jgi:hypothetical protein
MIRHPTQPDLIWLKIWDDLTLDDPIIDPTWYDLKPEMTWHQMIREPTRPDLIRPGTRNDPILDDLRTDPTWPDTIRNLKWLDTRWPDNQPNQTRNLKWPDTQPDPTQSKPWPDNITDSNWLDSNPPNCHLYL